MGLEGWLPTVTFDSVVVLHPSSAVSDPPGEAPGQISEISSSLSDATIVGMTRIGLGIVHLLTIYRVIDDHKLTNTSQTTLHLHVSSPHLRLSLLASKLGTYQGSMTQLNVPN